MNSATGTKKTVGFGKALVVFICVFALILCGINVLGTSAHIPLVIATIVAAIAGVSSGFTWDEMEKGMSETIKASAPAILIMLIIGMVVGTWMLGGIIPTMIYYGLTWLSPKIFLFAACALCGFFLDDDGYRRCGARRRRHRASGPPRHDGRRDYLRRLLRR